MKIVFLCSSLEPGRDGVGDYTRRLAGELIHQNHQVGIVALNDSYVSELHIGFQETEGNTLSVLRIPSNLSVEYRFEQAKIWIDEFNPEWLSLQFVLFGFHSKGLPFGLSKRLSQLGVGRQWHIMFHELWVGMNLDSSVKLSLWGWLQRKLVQDLLLKLYPTVVHTQSQLHQLQLAKVGIQAYLLPLFSNIPRVKLDKNKIPITLSNKKIKFVLFGTIHPKAPVEDFVQESVLFAQHNKVQLSLTIIGRVGKEQKRWAETWRDAGLSVDLLGEQSPEYISTVLQNANIGISTTVFELLEKSGSVAAMREHGLPVICVAQSWQPRENVRQLDCYPEVFEYQNGSLGSWLLTEKIIHYKNDIYNITQQFSKSLRINI